MDSTGHICGHNLILGIPKWQSSGCWSRVSVFFSYVRQQKPTSLLSRMCICTYIQEKRMLSMLWKTPLCIWDRGLHYFVIMTQKHESWVLLRAFTISIWSKDKVKNHQLSFNNYHFLVREYCVILESYHKGPLMRSFCKRK